MKEEESIIESLSKVLIDIPTDYHMEIVKNPKSYVIYLSEEKGREYISFCIDNGIDIINGLHFSGFDVDIIEYLQMGISLQKRCNNNVSQFTLSLIKEYYREQRLKKLLDKK